MDPQQAFTNYDQELLGKSWEDLVFEAKEHWESLLARVQADLNGLPWPASQVEFHDPKRMDVFYSNLYRTMLFPRLLAERRGGMWKRYMS